MTNIIIAIVFGGDSPEHNESIKAARLLYRNAIKNNLDHKYNFKYMYLNKNNIPTNQYESFRLIIDSSHKPSGYDIKFLLNLGCSDVVYNMMMGCTGEAGDVQGTCKILNVPIIGCNILASALSLNKQLAKIVAKGVKVPVVPSFYVNKEDCIDDILLAIEERVQFPCFVKPDNLGTCAFIFRCDNPQEFIRKWKRTIEKNTQTDNYLIEKYVPNIEVRVFIYQDCNDRYHLNDEYVTILKNAALDRCGALFDHIENDLPSTVRIQIQNYAIRIFETFGMSDMARIDFFVSTIDGSIYFNEANTQPFIGSFNIELMEKDGISYAQFLDTMIKRNLIL